MYFLSVSVILLYLSRALRTKDCSLDGFNSRVVCSHLEPRSLRSRCCRFGFIQGLLGLHVAALCCLLTWLSLCAQAFLSLCVLISFLCKHKSRFALGPTLMGSQRLGHDRSDLACMHVFLNNPSCYINFMPAFFSSTHYCRS